MVIGEISLLPVIVFAYHVVMKVHQLSPDLLIVESLDSGFTKLCIVGFLLMLMIGVFQLYRQPLCVSEIKADL